MTGLVADFLPALMDPARPVPEGLTDGAGRPAGRRFAVYRNNVTHSLTEALATGFPAILGLLGEVNFRPIAREYLRGHPPQSPLMMHYGADFPAFLEGFPPLAHLPYLGDVARLELALRASYHAADHVALDAPTLAAIPPEALADTRLAVAPSLRLLRSPWPVRDVWAFTLRPDQPKPQAGAQDVAVIRSGFDPEPHVLPPGAAAFIAALAAGETLGEAAGQAEEAAPAFDLPVTLSLLLTQGALCAP